VNWISIRGGSVNWIPIIDKMPEHGQLVIAVDDAGDIGIAEFINGLFKAVAFGFDAYENNGSWESGADRIIGQVKYWMPVTELFN